MQQIRVKTKPQHQACAAARSWTARRPQTPQASQEPLPVTLPETVADTLAAAALSVFVACLFGIGALF